MSYDLETYNQSCGIGVVISDDDILSALDSIISQNQEKIVKEGWENRGLQGQVMGRVKSMLKWADSNRVKNLVD